MKNNVIDVPSEDGTTSTTTSFVKATTCPASFCHTSYTFSLVVSWFWIDKDALHTQTRANLSILITPKTSSALFKKSKVQHTNVNCCHISILPYLGIKKRWNYLITRCSHIISAPDFIGYCAKVPQSIEWLRLSDDFFLPLQEQLKNTGPA